MTKPSAFDRAWGFLDYSRLSKWTAWLAGAGAALCTLLLLAVLGLFLDLLVYRGQVPTLADLTPAQRYRYSRALENYSAADRERMLAEVGVTGERLNEFDAERSTFSPQAREWLWRSHVHERLTRTVSPTAAAVYGDSFDPQTLQPRPDMAGLGILGLVVRSDGRWLGPLVALLARTGSWAWWPYGIPEANARYLTGLLVMAVVLACLRTFAINRLRTAAARVSLAAATRLRRAVYHHTYRLGTLAVRSLGPTEAVSVFTKHVDAVQEALYARLVVIVTAPLALTVLLLFAFALHVGLALAFVLFAGVVLLVGERLAAGYRARATRAERSSAAQLGLLEESLLLMRVVKTNLMEQFNTSRVERQLESLQAAQMVRRSEDAVFRPALVLLALIAGAIGLYAAGWVALRDALGVPTLVLLATTLAVAYKPLQDLLKQGRALERGRVSAATLFEFLDRPSEVGQAVGAEFLPALAKEIAFEDVSLREPGSGRRLLSHVTLRVPAGGRVAIVGEDDAAKYALLYLIPRFLDPNRGVIRIDGKDVRGLTLDSLRAQIGMVASNLIFNDTVANNIGCGDPAYTLPRIISAAKTAHAHQFIQKLPLGYETPIGEMGNSLRPGERFRIALARAILRDPALVIVEEPEDLDEATKSLLDDTFSRFLRGRTSIFLPRRLSTIRHADAIYVLHKGKVVESGHHKELVRTSDLYRHLYYVQFNEFADKA